jgi:hypothetical protein
MSAMKKQPPGPLWKPGQSGNPGGRPRIPDELRGIQSLSQLEVCKLVSKYARMTKEELQASVQDSKTPVLEMAIASIFAQSIKQGDYTRLAFLLDRAIGKVREVPEDEDADSAAARGDLKVITTEELLRFVQATSPQTIEVEKK